MEQFAEVPRRFRFLLCSDVDGPSSSRIAEHFVPNEPEFDAILLIGPFNHNEIESKEEMAVTQGDISSIIAQFENIVCRVMYLPTSFDPPDILMDQLNLTPNSVSIHGRQLDLTKDLFLMGFSEKGGKISYGKLVPPVEDRDRSAESDDEMENVGVASAESVSIIEEMLTNCRPVADHQKDPSVSKGVPSGIFALNYRFSHTLNHVLFHMGERLDSAGVNICILSSVDCPETDRLPAKFANFHLVAPKSLRVGGYYTTLDVSFNETTKAWDLIKIETNQLK
mmetsp:Transcript_13793/g.22971  ORF Transcript_13793/g.22971 Transcript_13793/m.22971 type:complete len:281 (-) Transcript_13793:1947-2789(-)